MSPGPLPVHKPRLEALSDGIIAVVMTLLVLELKVEHLGSSASSAEVWAALHEIRSSLIGYIAAFCWAGLFWFLHHQVLALLHRINGLFVTLTLAFLLAMSLLPFSVSLFMHAPGTAACTAVYYGNFALVGLTLLVSWLYARTAGLVGHSSVATRSLTYRLTSVTLAGVAATLGGYFISYLTGTLLFVVVGGIGGRLRRRLEATAAAPVSSESATP